MSKIWLAFQTQVFTHRFKGKQNLPDARTLRLEWFRVDSVGYCHKMLNRDGTDAFSLLTTTRHLSNIHGRHQSEIRIFLTNWIDESGRVFNRSVFTTASSGIFNQSWVHWANVDTQTVNEFMDTDILKCNSSREHSSSRHAFLWQWYSACIDRTDCWLFELFAGWPVNHETQQMNESNGSHPQMDACPRILESWRQWSWWWRQRRTWKRHRWRWRSLLLLTRTTHQKEKQQESKRKCNQKAVEEVGLVSRFVIGA